MSMTVGDTLEWWAREIPSNTALSVSNDDVTYAALNAWVNRVAHLLAEKDIVPGERVGIFGPNTLDWCVAALAIIRAGAILVPLNYRYTSSELTSVVQDAAPRMVVVGGAHGDRAQVLEMLGIELLPMEAIAAHRNGEASIFRLALSPDAPVAIAYTSGSTAQPKGAVLSHRSMLGYAFEHMQNHPQNRVGCRVLTLSPLYTGGGTIKLTQYLIYGGTHYIEPGFDPVRAIKILVRERIEVFTGVPIFFERIAAAPGFAEADLSCIRLSMVGGARVSTKLLKTWATKGVIVRQLYGLTEGGGTTSVMSEKGALQQPEKCGRGGVFTRHRVVDAEGRECLAGELGEIQLQGPSVMLGYWSNPQATADAFVDGWLRTGDLGTIDAAGNIQVVDRLKDVIISGGLNISAIDVEAAIAEMPGVAEVAVIGTADPVFAETPLAIVYPSGAISAEDIVRHCNAHLADYKVPRYVAIETEPLPRLATGKISKRALREKYQDAATMLPRVR